MDILDGPGIIFGPDSLQLPEYHHTSSHNLHSPIRNLLATNMRLRDSANVFRRGVKCFSGDLIYFSKVYPKTSPNLASHGKRVEGGSRQTPFKRYDWYSAGDFFSQAPLCTLHTRCETGRFQTLNRVYFAAQSTCWGIGWSGGQYRKLKFPIISANPITSDALHISP